jgi:hypothetical protein
VLDEDIWQDTRLSGYRHIGHEVRDHMSRSVGEARIVAIGASTVQPNTSS